MIPRITDELVNAMAEGGGAPLFVEDRDENRYVLLPAEQFEKIRALVLRNEIDPSETYPAIDEVMREGWEDPAMDIYDEYDAQRPAR